MIGRAFAGQVAAAFGIALPAGVLLVTGLQALRLSPVAVAAGARGHEWAGALGAAAVLGVEPVAPAAFAIAAVLVALRWESQGELLAARAAGLAPLRLARASAGVILVIGGLLALVSAVAAPAAARHLARTWEALLPRAIVGTVRPGAMVEVLPGLQVYAARRRPGGVLEDVVIARDEAVLAAKEAHLGVARGRATGSTLVVALREGTFVRGAARARFQRLVLPVDLDTEVALRRGALGDAGPAGGRGLASFGAVALASLLAALLFAPRPAALAGAVVALVAARELAQRIPSHAALPLYVLLPPLVALALLAARRDTVPG